MLQDHAATCLSVHTQQTQYKSRLTCLTSKVKLEGVKILLYTAKFKSGLTLLILSNTNSHVSKKPNLLGKH